MIDLFATAILCGLSIWLVLAAIAHNSYPLLRPLLFRLNPEQSSSLALGWIATPFIASVAITALLYWPDLARWLVADHCHQGTCQQHGPTTSLARLPALLLLVWFFIRLLSSYFRHWLPSARLRRQLEACSHRQQAYFLLANQQPSAFTLGFYRPSIFISEGLAKQSKAADIQCILDHEYAHQARADNFRQLLAQLFCAPLPSHWMKHSLSDHTLFCEQACDLAASQSRPRDEVAATLLSVSRLQQQSVPAGASAFSASHTEQRIHTLLAPPKKSLGRLTLASSVCSMLLVLALVIDPLHWLLEQLH